MVLPETPSVMEGDDVSAVEEYIEEAAGWDVVSTKYADAAIAELGARIEHDEDNLEGLQHALVRANQRYTQAETASSALLEQFRHVSEVALEQQRRAANADAALAERDRMLREAWLTYCRHDYLYGPWLFDLRARAEKGSGS